MVERTKSGAVERFDGTVKMVEKTPSQLNAGEEQWHIGMEPLDSSILKDTKTGMFHEWLRISSTSTDESVAEGSVLDNYMNEVEACIPGAKKLKTVSEVLNAMKGKKFRFVRKILGRSFEGKESKPVFVPQVEL